MKIQKLALPLITWLLSALVVTPLAQEKTTDASASAESKEKLPSAQEIVDRFVKEIGGKENFTKLKSQRMKATMDMPAQQMTGKMEAFGAQPNKLLVKIDMGAAGVITSGYDGKVAWMINPFTGPMLLEGKQKQQMATEADFDHFLHDPKDYKTMEVLGSATFEGEDCWKLKLVDHYGIERTEFFSKKSGLQVGMVGAQETPFGPVNSTTALKEYKNFEGIMFPTRLVQKAAGMEQVLTISEMEFNKVPPETFALPEQVKALVK